MENLNSFERFVWDCVPRSVFAWIAFIALTLTAGLWLRANSGKMSFPAAAVAVAVYAVSMFLFMYVYNNT